MYVMAIVHAVLPHVHSGRWTSQRTRVATVAAGSTTIANRTTSALSLFHHFIQRKGQFIDTRRSTLGQGRARCGNAAIVVPVLHIVVLVFLTVIIIVAPRADAARGSRR